jgi:hypothetical protein
MSKFVGEDYFKLGFWFGNLVVRLLEKLIPAFRNHEKNIWGFTSPSLSRCNYSTKENFKNDVKKSIAISFGVFFWYYLIIIFESILLGFILNTKIAVVIPAIIFASITFFVFLYSAFVRRND